MKKLIMFILFFVGLAKPCPCGKTHPIWQRLCFERLGVCRGEWHGGILDTKTGLELQLEPRQQHRGVHPLLREE